MSRLRHLSRSIPSLDERLSTTAVQDNAAMAFILGEEHRSYKHQYSNIYFHRLSVLRKYVEDAAQRRWKGIDSNLSTFFESTHTNTLPSGNPVLIPSVLEVVKSQVCYIVGTVYMDMPLKPNVMDDIGKDVSFPFIF
jgi:DNA polymerase delta subunit 2